jgi:hypothetical protein
MIEKRHVRVNTLEINAEEILRAYKAADEVCLTPLQGVISLADDEELALFCLPYLQAGEINNFYGRCRYLHQAIDHGMVELSKKMVLDHSAAIDALSANGHRPICLAAAKGHVDILRFLLEQYEILGRKEEILKSSCKKFSLMTHAIEGRSLPALKFLVKEMGQDSLEELVFSDKKKMYPHINAAARAADVEMVKWFLTEGGVPVDLIDKAQMQTVLHAICGGGIPEEEVLKLVKLCVELHQTNIGLVDIWQRSAAACAYSKGNARS